MIFGWLVIAAMLFAKFLAGVLAQESHCRTFWLPLLKQPIKFALKPGLHHSHENCRTCLGLGLKLDLIAVNILVATVSCKISLLAVIATI